MTYSIREQIIRAIMRTLWPVASEHGAVLARRPVDAYSEDDAPIVLAVFPESDVPSGNGRSNDKAMRTLTVSIVSQVFDADDPDGIADAMLVDAHRALFENRNLDGLAQTLRAADFTWLTEGGLVPVGQIPATYEIDYRTLEADLSVKG